MCCPVIALLPLSDLFYGIMYLASFYIKFKLSLFLPFDDIVLPCYIYPGITWSHSDLCLCLAALHSLLNHIFGKGYNRSGNHMYVDHINRDHDPMTLTINKSRPLSLLLKVLPSHRGFSILDWSMLEIFQRQKFQSVKANNDKRVVNWIS